MRSGSQKGVGVTDSLMIRSKSSINNLIKRIPFSTSMMFSLSILQLMASNAKDLHTLQKQYQNTLTEYQSLKCHLESLSQQLEILWKRMEDKKKKNRWSTKVVHRSKNPFTAPKNSSPSFRVHWRRKGDNKQMEKPVLLKKEEAMPGKSQSQTPVVREAWADVRDDDELECPIFDSD